MSFRFRKTKRTEVKACGMFLNQIGLPMFPTPKHDLRSFCFGQKRRAVTVNDVKLAVGVSELVLVERSEAATD